MDPVVPPLLPSARCAAAGSFILEPVPLGRSVHVRQLTQLGLGPGLLVHSVCQGQDSLWLNVPNVQNFLC